MQVVRTIVESSRLEKIVDMPKEFKNKKVELLILPVNQKKKKKKFNPEDFEGILDLDSAKIDAAINSMREEWERF